MTPLTVATWVANAAAAWGEWVAALMGGLSANSVDLLEKLPRASREKRGFLNAMTYSVQSTPIVVGDIDGVVRQEFIVNDYYLNDAAYDILSERVRTAMSKVEDCTK
jgi:hypothetical protein